VGHTDAVANFASSVAIGRSGVEVSDAKLEGARDDSDAFFVVGYGVEGVGGLMAADWCASQPEGCDRDAGVAYFTAL
jgi:hypothetical protein